MTQDLWQLSAAELASGIKQKQFTSEEATRSAIERMAVINPQINAMTVDLSDSALKAAKAADKSVGSGPALGPLHGVPVTIKENVDQAGLANTNGLPALAEVICEKDAPVVTNMTKAGAIVIGRTNVPEFSFRWFSTNPLYGKTLNPWNNDVTPGGSSGGAAASLVMGIGALAHGNDIGGSLRYPAYACGVTALRPSLGRVPTYNASAQGERALAMTLMSVHGPIARNLEDLRIGYEVMSAGSASDPWWCPAPLVGPEATGPMKVAISKWNTGLDCHASVEQALNETAKHLSAAGYETEIVDPPQLGEVTSCWQDLMTTEIRAAMHDVIQQIGSDDINKLIGDILTLIPEKDLKGYVQALASRTGLIRDWQIFMEDYPLVVLPVSQVPPFAQDEDLKGQNRTEVMLKEQEPLYGINLLGLPSVAVPTGVFEGLPTGVQIVGRKFREDQCLDAAEAVEKSVGTFFKQLWDT